MNTQGLVNWSEMHLINHTVLQYRSKYVAVGPSKSQITHLFNNANARQWTIFPFKSDIVYEKAHQTFGLFDFSIIFLDQNDSKSYLLCMDHRDT